MATKSKNDWSVVWSIIALVVAVLSIGYCFSHVIDMVGNGMERSSRAIAYFTRIVKGNV